MRVIFAAPTVAVVMLIPELVVMEVLRRELDRSPCGVRFSRVVPGVLIARERRGVGHGLSRRPDVRAR